MEAKERHKENILRYLGNPNNEFVDRVTLAKQVLGFARHSTLYVHFTPDELYELEREALAMRRKRYTPALARIDKAMINEGTGGNDKAAKLCYQRFENWGERKEMSGPDGKPVQFVFVEDESESKQD